MLKDDLYREKIKQIIHYYTTYMESEDYVFTGWELLKDPCKKASIAFSKRKRWIENKEESELKDLLSQETDKLVVVGNRSTDLYDAIQNKLHAIETNKCKGAIIRAKAKYITDREKSTTYFLSLENRKQSRSYINTLRQK